MKNIYVVTAFGIMIDTICEVFNTEEDALRFVQNQFDTIRELYGDILLETIVEGSIWKTNDPTRQTIEWQIHRKTLTDFPY